MLIGWDIGGVNTKVATVEASRLLDVCERPFELQRDPRALPRLLRDLAAAVGAPPGVDHAVTMTAELSQLFRTKREGVCFVLDALAEAFPEARVRVFTVDGLFVAPDDARANPLGVAAANWMATAMIVARQHPDAIVIDIGTTTTDIIPIVSGRVAAVGRTDLDRLTTGELCYTGAVRTPVEALVREVEIGDRRVAVSAEGFALAGDVHVWRGDLAASDYEAATPDGRPATRAFAGERLRRIVCADRDMLTDEEVSAIAACVARKQVEQIVEAIGQVRSTHPGLTQAVVAGRGAFLAAAAARLSGLEVRLLSGALGAEGAHSAPAVAVALLGEEAAGGSLPGVMNPPHVAPRTLAAPLVDVVIKVGGGMLATPGDLDGVCAALDAFAGRRVLIVPGGGPFADVVREVDRQQHLSDDAAHWMAIRAMDVFAEMLVSRLTRGTIVDTVDQLRAALRQGRLPVLAPFRWLKSDDVLPHAWSVTSDSIAAWLAGELGASELILIKPRGARGTDVTDPFFSTALPKGVHSVVVTVDDLVRQPGLLGASIPVIFPGT